MARRPSVGLARGRRPKVRNIAAWRTVYDAVASNPLYDQATFAYDLPPGADRNICGSGACICGSGAFALKLIRPTDKTTISAAALDPIDFWQWDAISDRLGRALGLTAAQSDRLFTGHPYEGGWPSPFDADYGNCDEEDQATGCDIQTALEITARHRNAALALLEHIMYESGPKILDHTDDD